MDKIITIPIILVAIIAIIAFLIFLKVFKSVVKAIVFALVIVIVLVAIFGVIVYTDANKLKSSIDGQKTILLIKNDSVVAAANINAGSIDQMFENGLYEGWTGQKLSDANIAYKSGKLDQLLTGKGILLAFNYEYLKTDSLELTTQIKLNKAEIEQILDAKSMAEINPIIESKNIIKIYTGFSSPEEVKAKIAIRLVAKKIQSLKMQELANAINKGDINIQPKFLTIKIIQYLPESMLNSLAQKN